jgi:hypothetical protein
MKMRGIRGLDIRWVLLFAVVAMMATGCSKTLPQSVADVNRTLGEAKDACATVYAADELNSVQGEVNSMNELADAKKYKKAGKAAEPLLPRVEQLADAAADNREAARKDAEASMAKAKAAMEDARKAEAPTLVASAYNQAKTKSDEAARLFSDPCKYNEAKAAADEAARLAANASAAAVAEKKRLEEEARRAEEERLRREAEEARRAEEEMLRRFPPVYTVQKGDSLWKISGMQKIYDNSIFWPIVYDANSGQINDPDLIYPGQEFSIPRGKEVEEMEVMLFELWRELSAEADALEE